MKSANEYIREAHENYPVHMEDTAKKIALSAVTACLQDHDKFCEETLDKMANLVEKLRKSGQMIDRLNQLLSEIGDQTS